MNNKTSRLTFLIASCLLATSTAYSAPLLSDNPTPTESQILRNNAWLEIDNGALVRNIDKLKQRLSPKTKICAIVKADAYGNSLDLIMPTLISAEIPCLGFASNEEAKIARKHGYKGVLMRVRTATLNEIEDALHLGVEELVGSRSHAEEMAKLAEKQGKTISIHIAINANGLSRNGFELANDKVKQDALAVSQLKSLKIVGLMTHYPVEDVDDVKRNLTLFNEQSAWLIKEAGLDRNQLTLHTANTFATFEVPESHLDMVRVGGAIYGDLPWYPLERTISSFKTTVASVNHYPKGNTIGYDRTVTLVRDSVLANLPMGYADGYRRAFSNKAFVLIKGHRVPVVGKISMNTTMVDITDFPDITLGDEVVLFGKQGENEITQEELEEIHGALLADIYTQWANSNPRVLKK